jgi:hypothetical protein
LPRINLGLQSSYLWFLLITVCATTTQLVCWDAVSLTFCLSWPQTSILLISASWVATIKGMSHHTWPFIDTFYLAVLGVELRASCLLSRRSTT